MDFTDRDMQACIQYFAEIVHKEIQLLFPEPLNLDFRINYVAGCNFAIVNFGGVGIYRSKPFDKIYVSVDPFRPGNQITTPFSPRIITARLMLENVFKSIEFSWITIEDMRADIVQLEREARKCLVV